MIIRKFEEQVEQFPHNAAVKSGNKCLTYSQLDRYANRVANEIARVDKSMDDSAQQGVALLFEHGTDIIAGLISTLKAGGIYIPLEINYPPKRLAYMLDDSGSSLILTNTKYFSLAEQLVGYIHRGVRIVNIDSLNLDSMEIDGAVGEKTVFKWKREAAADTPAYILYTSGSTGWPKGVVQTHGNVLYFIRHWVKRFSITGNDRMTLISALGHDAAVPDIFSSLLTGACLYPYSVKAGLDANGLYGILTGEKVTIWHSAPSLFRFFAETLAEKDCFPDIRWVLLGGEPLRLHDLELYKTFFPKATLANIYGQTESTVNSICLISRQDIFDNVTIGEPLDETDIFLVNKDGDIVEDMGVGEIVVASDYIAPGYWRDEKKTREVFLHDEELGYLYRTGDMGRLTSLGTIKMMGRRDHQVKIRGFRIELGEIESQLLTFKKIKEAIVLAREYNNDIYLCAYIVAKPGETNPIDQSGLKEYLSNRLPDYMVPSYFVQLDKIPLTPNGKVDRKALPEPEMKTGENYVAPRNEIEKKLVDIWSEILDVEKEKIGINDNFFHIGGHSLKATVMASRIHKGLNINIALMDIFKTPHIRGLTAYIKEAAESRHIPVDPVEKMEYYPLSSAHRRLYILDQIDEQGIGYNMPSVWRLTGNLDEEKFESIFQGLIRRHESLRTFFTVINDEPVQRIEEETVIGHWSMVIGEAGKNELGDVIKSFIKPFDLSHAPLLRIGLININDQTYILMVDMHHIISDGISTGILIREFTEMYAGKSLMPLKFQYKDYSQWQKEQAGRDNIKEQETYWLNQFSGKTPILELPMDYPRPAVQDFTGAAVHFEIDKEETAALKCLTRERDVTLFMLLLSLYTIFLFKLTSQEDIVVGIPIAGRRHTDLEGIIGMFVNTLALRNFPVMEKTFNQFLGETKKNTIKAFENQDYLYENLVEKVAVERDMGRNPLFDTMFALQNFDALKIEIPGLKVQPIDYETHISKFDLTLTAVEAGESLLFIFEYRTKLFKEETIQRFISFFTKTISTVIEKPGIIISGIEIINEEEKNRILHEFNDTAADYPGDKTIHRLFEEQVNKTPDHIAVVGKGEVIAGHGLSAVSCALTYRELNRESNQLAYALISRGVGPENIVGIIAQRSIEMLLGILAVLKSGGAYLPVSPELPTLRKEFMLKDSSARILLLQDHLGEKNSELMESLSPADIFFLDGARCYSRKTSFSTSLHNPRTDVKPGNPGYIIYTSGSTGRPKGVVLEHKGIVNYVRWAAAVYVYNQKTTFPFYTSFSFDLTVTSIFTPLVTGNAILIYSDDAKEFLIKKVIRENRVDIVKLTPSHLKLIRDLKIPEFPAVKRLILGGETLDSQLAGEIRGLFRDKIDIYNEYGPTETVVGSMIHKFDPLDHQRESVPIGVPISNTRIYLLDNNRKPVPLGISGELFIGGTGIGRGYLNRPEMTAEKFVPDHFLPGSRMYATGDLARRYAHRHNDKIEFLGRKDWQVKVRGFRIEPGEIQSCLLKLEDVREAVVMEKKDESGDNGLCAFLVLTRELDVQRLRRFLSEVLADYMIPSHFYWVDKIPLTVGGKVDKKALLESGGTSLGTNVTYLAPRDEKEQLIADICREVFGVDKIGMNDNFFSIGANSFSIIRLNKKLQDVFKKEIPVVKFFEYSTIASLLEQIDLESVPPAADVPDYREDEHWMDLRKKGQDKFRKLRDKRIKGDVHG